MQLLGLSVILFHWQQMKEKRRKQQYVYCLGREQGAKKVVNYLLVPQVLLVPVRLSCPVLKHAKNKNHRLIIASAIQIPVNSPKSKSCSQHTSYPLKTGLHRETGEDILVAKTAVIMNKTLSNRMCVTLNILC